MDKHVVIIGSGLGGLACGIILAAKGFSVTIVEAQAQAGGCLQCFRRGEAVFETGMHYIGSARPGQTLHTLFRYLGIESGFELSALDADGYDVVSIGGRRFSFHSGHEAFVEQMGSYFPRERAAIRDYAQLVRDVAATSSLRSFVESNVALNSTYQLLPADKVIGSLTADPLLRAVLAGNLPLYAGEAGKTPFALHAFISHFYNESAFRIVGCSERIANALARRFEALSGKIVTRCRATQIRCNAERATGVETADGRFIEADVVISDAHPMRTLELLPTPLIRPAFRRRIAAAPQTVGAFTVYLRFKPRAVPYMNCNFFSYKGDTPWGCEHYTASTWPLGYLYMHTCHESQPRFAATGTLIGYMRWDEVARWEGTGPGRRGAGYEAFKQQRAERLIAAAERDFPGLSQAVEAYYTSTPLTFSHYTGAEHGGMYGVARDVNRPAECHVSHRLRVPNVLQTGQSINSHGILGTLMGALVTCSALLGTATIYADIMKHKEEEEGI